MFENILFCVLGLIVGAAVGYFFAQSRLRSDGSAPESRSAVQNAMLAQQVPQLQQQLDQARSQLEQVQQSFATSRADCAAAQARVAELTGQTEYLKRQVAQVRQAEEARIANQKQRELQRQQEEAERQQREAAEESRILQRLAPVVKNLDLMQERMDSIAEDRKKDMGGISQQLQGLERSQKNLDKETVELASVLRDNKSRGTWGEVQLRNIVQQAGLTEHVDFDTQVVKRTDAGNDRPDMVIYMPSASGRKTGIPLDAKAPFMEYQAAMNITVDSAEAKAQKAKHLQNHARALKAHIDELARRNYPDDFDDVPDFTIAFIPNEAWLSVALDADPSLLEYAFSKRVALCSPVTLWAVLKSVAFSWQQQTLTDDARNILDLSRKIYSSFVTFGSHLSRLGTSISGTVSAYNRLIGNVERKILPSARKLQAMNPDEIAIVEPIDGEKNNLRQVMASELLGDDDSPLISSHDGESDANGSSMGAGMDDSSDNGEHDD